MRTRFQFEPYVAWVPAEQATPETCAAALELALKKYESEQYHKNTLRLFDVSK